MDLNRFLTTVDQENLMDQIRRTEWSAIHKVNLETSQISPFFQTIHSHLLENKWKSYISDGSLPDLCNITQINSSKLEFTEAIALKSYIKNENLFLTTGIKVSNNGIQFFWEQKLNPRLGKYLGIITLLVLGLAVLFRWILPITNYFPMLFFIMGISVNLFILFRAIYLFERHIQKDDDIPIIFLDTVMKFEDPKPDHHRDIISK